MVHSRLQTTGYAAIIFLLSFLVFLLTTAPETQFGDAGEFTTAAWSLGICHNPGYPIQSVVIHGFTRFLPCGAIAYRANLSASLFGSMGAVLVFLLGIRLGIFPVLSVAISLMYAFSALHWSQCTISEVYSLDAAWLILNLTLLSQCHRGARWILLLFASISFGVIIHLSQILYFPVFLGLGLFMLFRLKSRLYSAVCFLVLPWAILLYLPLRAIHIPGMNVGNPDRWTRFLSLITGSAHRKYQVMNLPMNQSFHRMGEYFKVCLVPSLTILGLLAAVFGLYRLYRRHPALALAVSWCIVANMCYAVFLNQVPFDATPFGIPVIGIGFITAGLALRDGLSAVRNLPVRTAVIAAVVCLPAGLVASNFPRLNRSDDFQPYRLIRLHQECLPYQSALIVKGDSQLFIGSYLREVEKFRQDVYWTDATGSLGKGPLPPYDSFHSQAAFLMAFARLEDQLVRLSGQNIFYTWLYRPDFIVSGLNIAPRDTPASTRIISRDVIRHMLLFPDEMTGKDLQFRRSMARAAMIQALDAFHDSRPENAEHLLQLGLEIGGTISQTMILGGQLRLMMGQPAQAIQMLESAKDQDPSNEEVYLLLAEAFEQTGQTEKADSARESYRRMFESHF